MAYSSITYAKSDGVATITKINKDTYYAMSRDVVVETLHALQEAQEDDEVKVVVITSETGVHQGAFVVSTVMDADGTGTQIRETIQIGHELCRKIAHLEKPVIGIIEKEATGGGFETLQPCDFLVAAETAKLWNPETPWGSLAGWGGVQRLARHMGWRQAQRFIYLGEAVTGKEAEELGMVTKSLPEEEIDIYVQELCEKLKKIPFEAFAYTKSSMNKVWDMNLQQALDYDVEVCSLLLSEGLHKSAISQIMAGETPEYKPYKHIRSGPEWH